MTVIGCLWSSYLSHRSSKKKRISSQGQILPFLINKSKRGQKDKRSQRHKNRPRKVIQRRYYSSSFSSDKRSLRHRLNVSTSAVRRKRHYHSIFMRVSFSKFPRQISYFSISQLAVKPRLFFHIGKRSLR